MSIMRHFISYMVVGITILTWDGIVLSQFKAHIHVQQDEFLNSKIIETNRIIAEVTNNGRFISGSILESGIIYKFTDSMGVTLVWDHSLWVIGTRNDTLMGTTGMWSDNYSPGPIIDGRAAVLTAPEDSLLYRGYLVYDTSGSGDADYDEWPSQWGAPSHPDGTPELIGDVMLWNIYNDADSSVHSFIESYYDSALYNTNIEVRELIWGYNEPGLMGDVLFFKWQIFNKSDSYFEDVVIAHWNDIDLQIAGANFSAYDLANKFGYLYVKDEDAWSRDFPQTLSYTLLQGPIVPSPGSTAYAFGKEVSGFVNLHETAFWGICDDGCGITNFGAAPRYTQYAYNFARGLRHDGSPIVNPVTNDTTTFTFTGNPATNEGWLIEPFGGGGAGYIVSSGTFDMAPGDSQEVIFALVPGFGDSLSEAIENLSARIDTIREQFNFNPISIKEESILPSAYYLSNNYPNPFNPMTKISYSLPRSSDVTLIIYNLLGEEVTRLVDGFQQAGEYYSTWNAINVSSSIYFYRLQTRDFVQTRKMLLLK